MNFIFVRHGETYANVEKRIYGSTHSEFTEVGLEQVERIVDYVRSKHIDYIYSSPQDRTKVIANKIEKVVDKKAILVDEIREMNYGIFEGLTTDEAIEKYSDEYHQFMNDYRNYFIPKGENVLDFDKRVIRFLDQVKDEDGTSVIVTHGGVIRTALMHLLGLESEQRWHFKILPGMIIEIEYKDGYGVLSGML